jgi:hypothetical protein
MFEFLSKLVGGVSATRPRTTAHRLTVRPLQLERLEDRMLLSGGPGGGPGPSLVQPPSGPAIVSTNGGQSPSSPSGGGPGYPFPPVAGPVMPPPPVDPTLVFVLLPVTTGSPGGPSSLTPTTTGSSGGPSVPTTATGPTVAQLPSP